MNRTEGVLSEMRAMLTSMEMQDLFVSANTTRRAMKEIERLKAELDDCNSRLGKITTQVGLSTRELQDAASEALTPGEPKRCSQTFLGFH